MKIAHVETGKHLYGGALQVAYLLRGLRTYNDIESVLVCPPNSVIAEAAEQHAHKVIPVSMHGDHDIGFVARLKHVIQQEKPDILHLHSRRGADLWGGIAGRLCGVPTLLTRRVDNPEPRPWVAVKYKLYHHIVTISNGIREVLLNEGIAENRVTCVHSATDTDLYKPGGDRTWLNSELGLSNNHILIGVIAQLIARKGHRFLFDALPNLISAHPQLRVLIFGKGPIEQELRNHVTTLKLNQHVIFAGFRTDMERVLPCLDLVVHPALIEGLGVSLLQAAACEVPIIASNAGGMPEVVRHEANGLLVPPGDTMAIGSAIRTLLSDASLRKRYGANGRILVEREFSIQQMAAGNVAIYQQIKKNAGR